jgi:hypothetical protein
MLGSAAHLHSGAGREARVTNLPGMGRCSLIDSCDLPPARTSSGLGVGAERRLRHEAGRGGGPIQLLLQQVARHRPAQVAGEAVGRRERGIQHRVDDGCCAGRGSNHGSVSGDAIRDYLGLPPSQDAVCGGGRRSRRERCWPRMPAVRGSACGGCQGRRCVSQGALHDQRYRKRRAPPRLMQGSWGRARAVNGRPRSRPCL